ncbi:hypothetical protein MMC25_002956 [Agyrium rufum]|nr:hypothetical protein [Agyrium rufum]
MDGGGLNTPSVPRQEFNWIFLIELAGFGAVALTFLFYFNRIFAWLISLAIRSYVWRTWHLRISLEAVQISLLGGRIFFKGLRYHGQNETLLVTDGHITWRYWLRRVKRGDVKLTPNPNDYLERGQTGSSSSIRRPSGGEQAGFTSNPELPCRIVAQVRGLEWFIYNRTPAYDALLADLSKASRVGQTRATFASDGDIQEKPAALKTDLRNFDTSIGTRGAALSSQQADDSKDGVSKKSSETLHSDNSKIAEEQIRTDKGSLPAWLMALPVGLECARGAIMLGNENTSCILVTKFDHASGQVGAQSCDSLDLYRQTFDFTAQRLIMEMKLNRDYLEPQLTAAQRDQRCSQPQNKSTGVKAAFPKRPRTTPSVLAPLHHLVSRFSRSIESVLLEQAHMGDRQTASKGTHGVNQRWLGLSRYLEDDDENLVEQERWRAIEYAAVQTFVDFPTASIGLHWDVPGPVGQRPQSSTADISGVRSNINHAKSPKWEILFRVNGGTINYGPWTDRHRNDLQNLFFPAAYRNSVPALPLLNGQLRVYTTLGLRIEFGEQTIVRIPTREESKDWRWKGRPGVGETQNPKKDARKQSVWQRRHTQNTVAVEPRPSGWLDITIGKDSCISYESDLVAYASGYHSVVDIDLKQPEMSTSVNHDVLWRSTAIALHCDLSVPLTWNGQRNWIFEIKARDMDVFLLRDHIFLLTDLVNDLTSGPSQAFLTFVPFTYEIRVDIPNLKIFLNSNDSNIINEPTNVKENTFIVLWSKDMTASLTLPFNTYRPSRNAVTFSVGLRHGGFQLLTPSWNTHAAFMNTSDVALLPHVTIRGKYNYCTATSIGLTDTLVVDIRVASPLLRVHGALVRYLMVLRENYFGEDLHFQTLDEYQVKLNNKKSTFTENGTDDGRNMRSSNDLDVIMSMKVDSVSLALPCNLYPADGFIRLDIPTIELDLRFTNYYMDLEVDIGPLSFSSTDRAGLERTLGNYDSPTEMFIAGFSILGHRLFGLPPTEPTYVCVWKLEAGDISGEWSINFANRLFAALQCFPLSFRDLENALPALKPLIIHDVTYLSVRTGGINICLLDEYTAVPIHVAGINITFDDYALSQYSDHAHVKVRDITIGCTDATYRSRQRGQVCVTTPTQVYVETSLDLYSRSSKSKPLDDRILQQKHLQLQDTRTNRIPWLLQASLAGSIEQDGQQPSGKLRPAAMPVPPIPRPVRRGSKDTRGSLRSYPSRNGSIGESLRRTSLDPTDSDRRSSIRKKHESNSQPRSNQSRELGGFTMDSNIVQTRDGYNTLTVLLSSSFHNPYDASVHLHQTFDKQEMPSTDLSLFPVDEAENQGLEADNMISGRDDDTEVESVILKLPQGMRGFLTVDGLSSLHSLFSALGNEQPLACLDFLQIQSLQQLKAESAPQVLDTIRYLGVVLPALAFRIVDVPQPTADITTESQRTELRLNDLRAFMCSHHPTPSGPKASESGELGYLNIGRVEIRGSLGSIGHRSAMSSGSSLISLVVTDLDVSGAFHPGLSCDIDFEGMTTTLTDGSLYYITNVLETLDHVEELLAVFRVERSRKSDQRKHLVASLIRHAQQSRDPPFLTNTSYVLRSAKFHVRLDDSWKMVTKVRSVLLNPSNVGYLDHTSSDQTVDADLLHRDNVLRDFDKWRGWDLIDPSNSTLMNLVYGSSHPTISASATMLTRLLNLSLDLHSIILIVNPGHAQSKFQLSSLIVNVFSGDKLPRNDSGSFTGIADALDPLQVEISLHMVDLLCHWEILHSVTELYSFLDRKKASLNRTETEKPRNAFLSILPFSLHVCLAVHSARIGLQSPNINLLLRTDLVSASAFLASSKLQDQSLYLTISAEQILTTIADDARSLLSSSVFRPGLHLHGPLIRATKAPVEVLSAHLSCMMITLETKSDIQAILSAIDLAITHELQHVKKILESLREKTRSSNEAGGSSISYIIRKAGLAIQLRGFKTSLMLLPSLTYDISIGVVKSTLEFHNISQPEARLDLDVDGQDHGLYMVTDGKSDLLYILKLPPINLYMKYISSGASRLIRGKLAAERVVLDAASLHRAITTSLQSDLTTLRDTTWRDVENIKSHYQSLQLGGSTKVSRSPLKDRQSVLFDVSVVLAGLDIEATSNERKDRFSRLRLFLGPVFLQVSNQDLATHQKHHSVDCSIDLQAVRLEMKRITEDDHTPCGDLAFAVHFHAGSALNNRDQLVRLFEMNINQFEVNLYTGTASMLVDLLAHLRNRFQKLDLSEEIKGLRARQRLKEKLKTVASSGTLNKQEIDFEQPDGVPIGLFTAMFHFRVNQVQIAWNLREIELLEPKHRREDLVLSVKTIELTTRKENAARMMIRDFQIQMVPVIQSRSARSLNSALLPEIIFNAAYFSTSRERRLAFQVLGKSLDLRLTSRFLVPATDVQRSIALAGQELREVVALWNTSQPKEANTGGPVQNIIGNKRLSSLLVDADFEGASVYIQSAEHNSQSEWDFPGNRDSQASQGRYGQFGAGPLETSLNMRAPGIAWKVEYQHPGKDHPSLDAEIRIDASTNILHPTVVPLLLEISASLRDIVAADDGHQSAAMPKVSPRKAPLEDKFRSTKPAAILGSCRLNLGLRICRQEFSLTCQPIARVASTAKFENIHLSINTAQAPDKTRFFAVFLGIDQLHASVQHVYSRESTGNFEVDSVIMSLMNSKHISVSRGLSAILKLSPLKINVNAKQLHDFLLFREIWWPEELRSNDTALPTEDIMEPQKIVVQRYQEVAATSAFPWNATVSISQVIVNLDLGPLLGKSQFTIAELWASTKKSSDWEQSLYLGVGKITVESMGRMSGNLELTDLKVRSSIKWPIRDGIVSQTPVVEAFIRMDHLDVKAAFDYQAFLITKIAQIDFIMYNLRHTSEQVTGDRLVGTIDVGKVQVFFTTSSATQALALYQAFERLIQEKRSALYKSLQDIEKHLRRKSVETPLLARLEARQSFPKEQSDSKTPIRLQTDVAVIIRAMSIGAFPGTFFDNQIFKIETLNTAANFSVSPENDRVHSSLGLTLGQLRVALSSVANSVLPKTIEEISIDEVSQRAIASRGGTILKVPKVFADMQTWQSLMTNKIDYIFKSSFEGKVEVGWNYSRISFIRGMWSTHTRSLAHRLGKPLPQSALQISGGPQAAGEGTAGGEGQDKVSSGGSNKITAVVNVPASRYIYNPLKPPIIETPQLRDMGEATPPLEWIGLHRDRLPNLTHQIVIVTLLEVAKEVEDAYTRILGS